MANRHAGDSFPQI